MSLHPQTYPKRKIVCDHADCDWQFEGELDDRVATVRLAANEHGWRCDNPGPRKPARDLCPRHREVEVQ